MQDGEDHVGGLRVRVGGSAMSQQKTCIQSCL